MSRKSLEKASPSLDGEKGVIRGLMSCPGYCQYSRFERKVGQKKKHTHKEFQDGWNREKARPRSQTTSPAYAPPGSSCGFVARELPIGLHRCLPSGTDPPACTRRFLSGVLTSWRGKLLDLSPERSCSSGYIGRVNVPVSDVPYITGRSTLAAHTLR